MTFLLSSVDDVGGDNNNGDDDYDYDCDLQEMFSGLHEGVPTYYGVNMINQKITFPRDDNFSDDELSFLPYFLYFYTLRVGLPRCAYFLVSQFYKACMIDYTQEWVVSSYNSIVFCYFRVLKAGGSSILNGNKNSDFN